jgi:hypothetical protein
MAKELPYFKFEPAEWDNGNIQMCSRQSKGLFIELCSIYWSRLGELPHALALQKLCNGDKDALQELISHEIIVISEGQIVIEFLDEQLSEFGQINEKRRNSANKRWSDANAMQMHSKSNAIREEKKREEEKRKDKKNIVAAGEPATPEQRLLIFQNKVAEYIEVYPREMLRAFFDYWTEQNEGGRKFRFEMQKVFDVKKRLVTWSKNEKKGYGSGKQQQTNKGTEHAAGLVAALQRDRDKLLKGG